MRLFQVYFVDGWLLVKNSI